MKNLLTSVSLALLALSGVASATSLEDTIMVFRNGQWIFDPDNDGSSEGVGDQIVAFGLSGDFGVVGDINGDGRDEFGVYRPWQGKWYFDRENDGFQSRPGEVYGVKFGFSQAENPGFFNEDIPLIGNLDDDPEDELVIYRGWQRDPAFANTGGGWTVDSGSLGFGLGDTGTPNFFFGGQAGDIPLLGDIDGDGIDAPIIYRPGTNGDESKWFFDDDEGSYGFDGSAIKSFSRGQADHVPVVGDINGDGKDEVGLFALNSSGAAFWAFYDANENKIRDPDGSVKLPMFGLSGDQPLLGGVLKESALAGEGAVGHMCLHCGIGATDGGTGSDKSAKSISQAIGEANLKRPVISFLMDDSFGDHSPERQEYLKQRIDDIGGEAPIVHLFLTNGPAQRSDGKTGNGYATEYENDDVKNGAGPPLSDFHNLIENNDAETKQKFKEHFNRALELCGYVFTRNGSCLVSPQLEDNFSESPKSFDIVQNWMEEFRVEAGIDLPITLVRNAKADDTFAPAGDVWVSEFHTQHEELQDKKQTIGKYSIVSTDGKSRKVENDKGQIEDINYSGEYDKETNLANFVVGQGNIFVTWSDNLQGGSGSSGEKRTQPTDRVYTDLALNSKDRQDLINLLQGAANQPLTSASPKDVTAIPIPATAPLFLLALAALGFTGRGPWGRSQRNH